MEAEKLIQEVVGHLVGDAVAHIAGEGLRERVDVVDLAGELFDVALRELHFGVFLQLQIELLDDVGLIPALDRVWVLEEERVALFEGQLLSDNVDEALDREFDREEAEVALGLGVGENGNL